MSELSDVSPKLSSLILSVIFRSLLIWASRKKKPLASSRRWPISYFYAYG